MRIFTDFDIAFFPNRLFKIVLKYYVLPKRLTLSCNPPIYAWLWWNFGWVPK